jgi:hypothetical protein
VRPFKSCVWTSCRLECSLDRPRFSFGQTSVHHLQ